MAYDTLEDSLDGGRPISFYEFVFGTTTWRYTSADQDLTVGGFLWSKAAISDDGVRQTTEQATDGFNITAPSWVGPSQLFMSGSPAQAIQVIVKSKHEGDAELRVTYTGEVSQVNYPLPGACNITCETSVASMRREGLRLGWQRSCPYTVYDALTCKLNRAAWATTFTVTAISGVFVTATLGTARLREFFNLGFLEWTHPTRGVEQLQLGAYQVLAGPAFPALSVAFLLSDLTGDLFVGATGIAYPGCDFTPTNCTAFGNLDNYGGFNLIPGKSPFDGNPVFY